MQWPFAPSLGRLTHRYASSLSSSSRPPISHATPHRTPGCCARSSSNRLILRTSSNQQLLMSASEDKRLILHDVRNSSASGKPGSGAVASFSGHSSWVLSTDISPDSRLALSGYVLHLLHLLSTSAHRIGPSLVHIFLSSSHTFAAYVHQLCRQNHQSMGPRRPRRRLDYPGYRPGLVCLVETAACGEWLCGCVR